MALPQVQGTVGTSEGDLRKSLLKFIGNFANWDLGANQSYLKVARALVGAAYPDDAPLVVDPFAGGGSIPLEALRLGCEVFASDLNPVACLILRALLEDIPRRGREIAEELARAGAEIERNVTHELADFYPTDPDGAKPIAFIWARTVSCESPNCGAEIPLMRSFWLCKKPSRRRALRFRLVRVDRGPPHIEFDLFEPHNDEDVPKPTVSRANAVCLACSAVLPAERVRIQLSEQLGGADVVFDASGKRASGARMLAIVLLRGEGQRLYRLPAASDYDAVRNAQQHVVNILDEWQQSGKPGLCPIPDEPTPTGGGSGAGRAFSVQRYGMRRWGDLFTARQKVALVHLSRSLPKFGSPDVHDLMALVFSGVIDRNAVLATWRPQADQEKVEHVFSRQALSMTWDFAEAVPISNSTGSFSDRLDVAVNTVEAFGTWTARGNDVHAGQVHLSDAAEHPLPDDSAGILFTDPPYYDAVPYADLSDFFLVWLKRALPHHPLLCDPYDSGNPLTPKRREAVQDEVKQDDEGQPKNRGWFEAKMARSFEEGRRVLREDGVGSVVFAHKTTEGWEALLSGMIRARWTISASWPIATEMATRLRARDSAALATSVHLVCRPRPAEAIVGDWAEVLRELPKRVGDWMERLQNEGVRGADLVFACIGPALEIFSSYAKVETAEGREVALPEYLEKVWEVVGRSALEHVLGTAEARARNGAAGALEEDSRLTALFLWTIQSTTGEANAPVDNSKVDDVEEDEDEDRSSDGPRKGFTLVFDVVRRFAQPLGIDLTKWQGRIIETRKGLVRLLPITERAKQLFGADGAHAVAARLEQEALLGGNPLQGMLFPEMEVAPRAARRPRGALANGQPSDESLATAREATTLDRVHAAMLLQSSGRTNALRALLKAEQERSPEFLRLANALTALYPKGSEEKRLLDAMLLSVPR